MWARPAVKAGANVPDPYRMKELLADKKEIDRKAREAREWIQQGMKEDAEANATRSSGPKA